MLPEVSVILTVMFSKVSSGIVNVKVQCAYLSEDVAKAYVVPFVSAKFTALTSTVDISTLSDAVPFTIKGTFKGTTSNGAGEIIAPKGFVVSRVEF
ncbi:hypothetical protein [Candidatus Nitrososphaera evergladensis]|uniref:hypothetical protein n=1 Tax=Candidatus Nitrososphaera evergladensis TaxID=1459637 RepID=UPI0011E5B14C|nr:hypothetical protein [Candidatus Nitrososphaera evergladensis]